MTESEKDTQQWTEQYSIALHAAYVAMCEGRDKAAMNLIGDAIGLSPDTIGDAWKGRPTSPDFAEYTTEARG